MWCVFGNLLTSVKTCFSLRGKKGASVYEVHCKDLLNNYNLVKITRLQLLIMS